MRTSIFIAAPILLLVVAAVFLRAPSPQPEHTYQPEGDPVVLHFKVSTVNREGVELSLKRHQGDKMFIQFGISMGDPLRPVVTMMGVSDRSRMKGPASPRPLPDFPFLTGPQGQPVLNFAFENQLARDEWGNRVMRMTYLGVPVPLVEHLVISRLMTLPAFLSEDFGVPGPIQFQPGTLQLDRKIQGFWIPVDPILRD